MAKKDTEKKTAGRAKKKPSRRARFWTWTLRTVAAMILIGAGVASGVVSFRLLSYGREVIVPMVTHLRLAEATATLREAGLRYRIAGRRHDEAVNAAHILEQDLPPGNVVKEKSSVGLVVSLGSAYRETPDFLGRTLEESKLLAQRDEIGIVRVSRTRHESVEEGNVIAQNPVPGTTGRPDVSLLLSTGPFEVKVFVPSLIGQRAAVAQAMVSERGLRYRAEGNGGVIMWQRPEAGIPVPAGSEVTVGLEMGPGETGQYPWEGQGGSGWGGRQ